MSADVMIWGKGGKQLHFCGILAENAGSNHEEIEIYIQNARLFKGFNVVKNRGSGTVYFLIAFDLYFN